jgi:Arc/MetJ-type ribon-helix-helix transcriptional regulator
MEQSRKTVRFGPEMEKRLAAAAKERGFSSTAAFIRAAVAREVRDSSVEGSASLEAVAESVDRLTTEAFRLVRGQQALFAFLDSLSKVLLTCIPEPSGDAIDPAVARGRLRYDRLLKAAGRAMSGDAKAALQDLVARDGNDGTH